MSKTSVPASGLVEMRYVSNGEAGDGWTLCTGCDEETDDPHTWDVCAALLRKSRDAALDGAAELEARLVDALTDAEGSAREVMAWRSLAGLERIFGLIDLMHDQDWLDAVARADRALEERRRREDEEFMADLDHGIRYGDD